MTFEYVGNGLLVHELDGLLKITMHAATMTDVDIARAELARVADTIHGLFNARLQMTSHLSLVLRNNRLGLLSEVTILAATHTHLQVCRIRSRLERPKLNRRSSLVILFVVRRRGAELTLRHVNHGQREAAVRILPATTVLFAIVLLDSYRRHQRRQLYGRDRVYVVARVSMHEVHLMHFQIETVTLGEFAQVVERTVAKVPMLPAADTDADAGVRRNTLSLLILVQ